MKKIKAREKNGKLAEKKEKPKIKKKKNPTN